MFLLEPWWHPSESQIPTCAPITAQIWKQATLSARSYTWMFYKVIQIECLHSPWKDNAFNRYTLNVFFLLQRKSCLKFTRRKHVRLSVHIADLNVDNRIVDIEMLKLGWATATHLESAEINLDEVPVLLLFILFGHKTTSGLPCSSPTRCRNPISKYL